MPKQNKTIEIICLNCKEKRSKKSLTYLFKWRKQFNIHNLGIKKEYKIDIDDDIHWACDVCIKTKKVILAKPDKQDYSIHPYFVYLNLNKNCNSCNKEYIYTKEEQLFWYEELGENYWSRANNCLDCRRQKREVNYKNNKLSKLISNLNENDIESLSEVIELYLKMDKLEKAKFYLSKLKKVAEKFNFDYSSIESQINNN